MLSVLLISSLTQAVPKHLVDKLNLNDTQISELKEHRGAQKELMKDIKSIRKQLHAELKNETPDSAKVDRLTEKLKQKKNLLTDNQVKHIMIFKDNLTDEQKTLLTDLKKRHKRPRPNAIKPFKDRFKNRHKDKDVKPLSPIELKRLKKEHKDYFDSLSQEELKQLKKDHMERMKEKKDYFDSLSPEELKQLKKDHMDKMKEKKDIFDSLSPEELKRIKADYKDKLDKQK